MGVGFEVVLELRVDLLHFLVEDRRRWREVDWGTLYLLHGRLERQFYIKYKY
jgi:hypothetical protein